MFENEKIDKLYSIFEHQKPQKVDVVVFIQGDRFDRVGKTVELFLQGYASKILVSGNNILVGEGTRPGETDVSLPEIVDKLVANGIPKESIEIEDESLNTRDQAVNILKMCKKNGWKEVVLVTSPYHVPRVFLSFMKQVEECEYKTKIIMQPALGLDWDGIAGGRDVTRRELALIEVEKIQKYANDMMKIKTALAILNKNT